MRARRADIRFILGKEVAIIERFVGVSSSAFEKAREKEKEAERERERIHTPAYVKQPKLQYRQTKFNKPFGRTKRHSKYFQLKQPLQ